MSEMSVWILRLTKREDQRTKSSALFTQTLIAGGFRTVENHGLDFPEDPPSTLKFVGKAMEKEEAAH